MAKKEYNERSVASYVDKQKVKKKLQYIFKTYGVSDVLRNKIHKSLDDSATDAVHVVRCMDCARAEMILDIIGNPRLFCTCWRGNPEVEFDDFCSYGERRENNHG
ncbi:MAG: hypothetical protein IJF49_08375 [Clostridia bacterium]|nr:hypothetical protein [Clostridia bacterium]